MDDERFTVRLLFDVSAKDHKRAVGVVIDQLSRYGILDWVYRAQRLVDGETEHYNGDLEFIDLEALRAPKNEGEEHEDNPEVEDP